MKEKIRRVSIPRSELKYKKGELIILRMNCDRVSRKQCFKKTRSRMQRTLFIHGKKTGKCMCGNDIDII